MNRPFLVLENYDFDTKIVNLIPKRLAKKFKMIAIDKIGDVLTIATSNITDPYISVGILYAENRSKCNIQIFQAEEKEILKVIEQYYK